MVTSACLLCGGVGRADDKATDERPAEAGGKSLKKEKEEKGALRKRQDPAKDIAVQKQNVKRLEENAAIERKNGNRIGAWAAERDAKHAQKLIDKDEQQVRAHEAAPAAEEKTHRE